MEHRWGMGSRVGRRAAVGAATALALVVLQTGAALADDPTPSVPTPAGPLVDGFGVGFVGPDSTAGLPLLGISLDPYDAVPQDAQPAAAAAQPLPASGGRPDRSTATGTRRVTPVAIDRDVIVLTTCAFTAVGCASADPARLVWDLMPFVLGVPSDLPASSSPVGQPVVPPGGDPAAGQQPSATGQLVDGAAPALDAVGLALGTSARPGAALPAGAPATTPAAAPAAAPHSGTPPALASTGAPIVAALAGLVLLLVGGCLTWARART
jgi:hypothetical protein